MKTSQEMYQISQQANLVKNSLLRDEWDKIIEKIVAQIETAAKNNETTLKIDFKYDNKCKKYIEEKFRVYGYKIVYPTVNTWDKVIIDWSQNK